MKTMLSEKVKLALTLAVVADVIALICEYPTIYFGIINYGWSTYNVIELVSGIIH